MFDPPTVPNTSPTVVTQDLQRMSDLHLHLLLRCAVTVANDGDDAAQLHPGVSRVGSTTPHNTVISSL